MIAERLSRVRGTIIVLTRTRRLAGAVAVAAAVLTGSFTAGTPSATAAPAGPPMPVEFDLSRYQPVNPTAYRPLAYADNGAGFFRVGKWLCRVGPRYRYVGCQGRPNTAPPAVRGVAISGDRQGPFWVPDWSNYRFAAPSGFWAPALPVGKRLTIGGTTCTAPRPDTVACRTGERAFILQPGWHKFFFRSNDDAHSANPAPRLLPPRLQYWNQLPASPAIPV